MIRRLDLPDAGGEGAGDARLSAPSALRNRDLIAAELSRVAPARGRALEIASGTGEHVVRFAAMMQGLEWHPTDPDPARRASIAAWVGDAGLPNIRPALHLDAACPGWAAHHGPADLIVVVNLLHLISAPEAETVLTEVAAALAPGGVFALYGLSCGTGWRPARATPPLMPACAHKTPPSVTRTWSRPARIWSPLALPMSRRWRCPQTTCSSPSSAQSATKRARTLAFRGQQTYARVPRAACAVAPRRS